MLKPEQVPDEVTAALINRLYDNRVDVAWSDARNSIAAALNAWPDATVDELQPGDEPFLILPLPQEASDE